MALKNILVTGATGKQGEAVIKALLSNPKPSFQIYALTRNATSPSAQALASKPNITVVEGDTNNPAPIFKSISQPVHGVFSVTAVHPFKSGSFQEKQAILLIDAAVSYGVKQFVFTSIDRGGPKKADDKPHQSHTSSSNSTSRKTEKLLKATNMQYTILRPVAVYENLTPEFPGKDFATMWSQMGDVKLALVGTKDIGVVAAKAFTNPEDYANRAVTLVGDKLTLAQGSKIFEEVVGSKMPTNNGFFASRMKWTIHDLGAISTWFGEGGYAWDMSTVRKEEDLTDFRTWLRSQSKFQSR